MKDNVRRIRMARDSTSQNYNLDTARIKKMDNTCQNN